MFNLTLTDNYRRVHEEGLKEFLPTEFVGVHVHPYKSEFAPFGIREGVSKWPT